MPLFSEGNDDNENPAPHEAAEDDEGGGVGGDDIGGEDDGGGGVGDEDFGELPDAHEIGDAELAAEIPSAATSSTAIPAPLLAEVPV